MHHRLADGLKGLGSLALIAALVAGVPALMLSLVGAPWPETMPSWAEVEDAVGRGGDGLTQAITYGLAWVVWLAWLQLVISLAVEIRAVIDGRDSRRIRLVLPGVQAFASRLVTSAMLIATLLTASPAAAGAPALAQLPPAVTLELDLDSSVARSAPSSAPSAEWDQVLATLGSEVEPAATQPHVEVQVDEGDNLWDLAEAELEADWGRDPSDAEVHEYWTGVLAAVDGQLLPPGDPNLVYPGQVLEFPPVPPDSTAAPVAEADDAPSVGVAPDAEPDPEPVPPSEPDVAPPPPVVEAPTATPPPTPEATPTQTPRATPTQEPAVVAPEVDPPAETDDQGGSLAPQVVTVTGLGLVGAGLAWGLERLRRTQRQRRQPHRLPTRPEPQAQEFERRLVDDADIRGAEALEVALRALGTDLDVENPPAIVGVTLDPDRIVVLLAEPQPAPTGWEATDDGYSWTLDRCADIDLLRDKADGIASPLPALATVGHTDESQVLLDLEHVGHAVVRGEAEGFMQTVATELAVSQLADDVLVTCVGFGHHLDEFQRVDVVRDIEQLLPELEREAAEATRLMDGAPSALGARLASAAVDSWTPLVVLDPVTDDPAALARLAAVAGRGITILTANGNATWTLDVTSTEVLVNPIGVRLQRRNLAESEVAAIGDLVRAAKDLDGMHVEELGASPVNKPTEPAPNGIEVQVLGAVAIAGASAPFQSRRAVDMICYLAFHPDGVDSDQLKANLWHPDRPPTDSTFANTVSRARKALGTDASGGSYLPRVGPDGIYRLNGVQSDFARFERELACAGEVEGPEAELAHLRAALELVRGIPFTGGGEDAFRWSDNGVRSRIEFVVDEAAHRLADRYLEAGDAAGARWAATQGLLLIPECEQCYRRRFLAADLAGNRTELRQAMAELQRKVDHDAARPEGSDTLSPDLVELYEALLAGREAPVD